MLVVSVDQSSADHILARVKVVQQQGGCGGMTWSAFNSSCRRFHPKHATPGEADLVAIQVVLQQVAGLVQRLIHRQLVVVQQPQQRLQLHHVLAVPVCGTAWRSLRGDHQKTATGVRDPVFREPGVMRTETTQRDRCKVRNTCVPLTQQQYAGRVRWKVDLSSWSQRLTNALGLQPP